MDSKTIAILLAIMGALSVLYNQTETESTLTAFQSWKGKFNMKFESKFEEAYRERVFLENLEKINTHNINEHKTYELGVNQFTGMTQEEFVQQYSASLSPLTTSLLTKLMTSSSVMLTGPPKVPSPPSRTKVNAAHAGPSPPLVLLKV